MVKVIIVNEIIPSEQVLNRIYLVRSVKVMLDYDLAKLYNIETKVLKQAVRRNIKRFPDDFMFELSKDEYDVLRSQIVTSNRGGTRYLPMAFTEQGVAMLSSVLNGDRAVQVNIQIMRAFIQLRKMIYSNDALNKKIESLERKYDNQFRIVFQAIKRLLKDDENRHVKTIGFKMDNGKKK